MQVFHLPYGFSCKNLHSNKLVLLSALSVKQCCGRMDIFQVKSVNANNIKHKEAKPRIMCYCEIYAHANCDLTVFCSEKL